MPVNESFPALPFGAGAGDTAAGSVMMANGGSQGIGGIEELIFQAYTQGGFQHGSDLFLGSITITGYGLFDFFWGIFGDGHSFDHSCCDGYALSPAELEHGLNIFAKKRSLNGHFCRLVQRDNLLKFRKNALQAKLVLFRAFEMHGAHVYQGECFTVYFQNSETEDIGAGVHPQNSV